MYRAVDRAAPYWRLDPLGGREIQVVGFTTYGPMLVDEAVFGTGRIRQDGRNWLVTAGFGDARPAEVDALRARAEPLQLAFQRSSGLQVRTELPELIAELKTSVLVSRSTLLVGALQLAVLAAAALLLVVALMAARQENENSLLAARGAARRQLAALAAVEALLLALPAAALAPCSPRCCCAPWAGSGHSPGSRWTPASGGPCGPSRPAARWRASRSPRPPHCSAGSAPSPCGGPAAGRTWSPERPDPARTWRCSPSPPWPTSSSPGTATADPPRTGRADAASTPC